MAHRFSWAFLGILAKPVGNMMQAISMAYRLLPKAWTGNGQELSFNINALPKKERFSLHKGGLYCLYVITFVYTDTSLRKGLVQGGQCLGNSGPPPLPSFLDLKKYIYNMGLSPVITGPKSRPRPRTEPSTGFVFWATHIAASGALNKPSCHYPAAMQSSPSAATCGPHDPQNGDFSPPVAAHQSWE